MTLNPVAHRAIIAAAFAALAVLPPADAAAVTIQASFAPIRLTARPGEVFTTTYDLALQKDEPATHFKVAVQDWWRSEDGLQSVYAPAGSLDRSCGRWVAANPQEASASGAAPLQVRLTVTVPASVRPGGYWCAITVDEMPDPLAVTPDGVGVRFLASVSTGVYVNIDPIERGVDVMSVDILHDRAVARVTNTGNTPVAVEGRFEFLKPGGTAPVATVQLSRNMLLTEPIATGSYSEALPDRSKLPSGRYLVRLILDIGLDHYVGVQRELDIHRDDAPAAAPTR